MDHEPLPLPLPPSPPPAAPHYHSRSTNRGKENTGGVHVVVPDDIFADHNHSVRPRSHLIRLLLLTSQQMAMYHHPSPRSRVDHLLPVMRRNQRRGSEKEAPRRFQGPRGPGESREVQGGAEGFLIRCRSFTWVSRKPIVGDGIQQTACVHKFVLVNIFSPHDHPINPSMIYQSIRDHSHYHSLHLYININVLGEYIPNTSQE